MPQMKPILFNTEMVKEILEGRKTATRRVVKPQPPASAQFIMGICSHGDYAFDDSIDNPGQDDRRVYMAPYNPGDILYVRETWSTKLSNECIAQPCHTGWCPYESCESATGPCFPEDYIYKATDNLPSYGGKWRPSIHMPYEAARLFLKVKDVRVEHLQDITEAGARREGLYKGWRDKIGDAAPSAKVAFSWLWDTTVKLADRKRYAWGANPWVWVISFKRITRREAERLG